MNTIFGKLQTEHKCTGFPPAGLLRDCTMQLELKWQKIQSVKQKELAFGGKNPTPLLTSCLTWAKYLTFMNSSFLSSNMEEMKSQPHTVVMRSKCYIRSD